MNRFKFSIVEESEKIFVMDLNGQIIKERILVRFSMKQHLTIVGLDLRPRQTSINPQKETFKRMKCRGYIKELNTNNPCSSSLVSSMLTVSTIV